MSKLSTIVQRQLKHDAPYAWYLRNEASTSPIFRRMDLADLDIRLESYLACFQLNPHDRKLLLARINPHDWGSVFIMALIALHANDAEAFDNAIAALIQEQQTKELSNALCRVDYIIAKPFLDGLLVHENPLARIAAITAMGILTLKIENRLLHQLLNDTPSVIAATLKVVGTNKLFAMKDTVSDLLAHENQTVRFQAAYAGNLLGLPAAVSVLKSFCFEETPYLRAALCLLYHIVDESDITDSLMQIQKSTFSPRIKAHNIAMAGLPKMIPILIEWMQDPEYAPVAGEAFSFITGADIEEDDLSIINIELCESQEAPLAVKRKMDRWTEGYEEDLPWPDPELVTIWWQTHQHQFQRDTRYLAGKTLDDENLQTILDEGTQPQRIAASLILAVRHPEITVKDVTGFQTKNH